ncbi:MAG: hypothetical protein WC054_00545 [Candidatus Nanopelagicales bacterium]
MEPFNLVSADDGDKAVECLFRMRASGGAFIFNEEELHIAKWLEAHWFISPRASRISPEGGRERAWAISSEGRAFLFGVEMVNTGYGHA